MVIRNFISSGAAIITALILLVGTTSVALAGKYKFSIDELSRDSYSVINFVAVPELILMTPDNYNNYSLFGMGVNALANREWRIKTAHIRDHVQSVDFSGLVKEEIARQGVTRIISTPKYIPVERKDKSKVAARIDFNYGMNLGFRNGGVTVRLALDHDTGSTMYRVYHAVIQHPDPYFGSAGSGNCNVDECDEERKSAVVVNSSYWSPESFAQEVRDSIRRVITLMARDMAGELSVEKRARKSKFHAFGLDEALQTYKASIIEDNGDRVVAAKRSRDGIFFLDAPVTSIKKR